MAGQTTEGSWKALREAAGELRKVICYQIGRQAGIVDKWMLAPPADAAARDANGVPNPLDHVIALHAIVASDSPERADRMLDWLCRQCGGRFVRPVPGQRDLFPDLESVVKAAGLLHGARGKGKASAGRIAAARRTLQNFIDLAGVED